LKKLFANVTNAICTKQAMNHNGNEKRKENTKLSLKT